tara:strand:- start:2748 stop:3185 length:438 start_codon:yes stop_codon:yes gene_type:complete
MDDEIDKDLLMKALENEENEKMLALTSHKIMAQKNDILQKLRFDKDQLKEYHKKLKQYRYINDVDDLTYGNYIRWINIKDPEKIKLTNGAIVCEITVCDNGTHILCKNSFNRMFRLIMDECVIFQKLNYEEMILLNVLTYLDDNK